MDGMHAIAPVKNDHDDDMAALVEFAIDNCKECMTNPCKYRKI